MSCFLGDWTNPDGKWWVIYVLLGILVSQISGRWLLDLSRNSRIYDQEQLASSSVSNPELQTTLQNMLGCKKNNAPLSHHQDDMIHHFCSAILGIPPKRNHSISRLQLEGAVTQLVPAATLASLVTSASLGGFKGDDFWLTGRLFGLNAEKCGKMYQVSSWCNGSFQFFSHFGWFWTLFSCNLGWLPW